MYSFSNARNDKRTILKERHIEFVNEDALFITYASVDKLLIQSEEAASKVLLEKLDLNTIENALNENDMVKNADVYLTVNGGLGARIIQRTPIARVAGDQAYYIDEDGEYMPLSPVYSARVPLVTGEVSKERTEEVHRLAYYIYNDDFLRRNVIGIHKDKEGFELRFRTNEFVLRFSDITKLDKKFNNFKAFYQKGTKDKSLAMYKAVNLDYDNQVVCTKK
nr:hypothetical protein [Robertkochia marina]